ncbi:MAG: DUF72 domain-containing protein [Desulfofustis sp.]|nr:DUF72 domain-containing protein [Desulfofustis sp.]
MKLHIGTCSWKYDSWRGLIYPEQKKINYLLEYSRHFRTVEVDQWFWSLFGEDTAVMPKPAVVREYGSSVPDDFIFCAKVPNSITLTHHYTKNKKEVLRPNPCFLSVPLMERFLSALEPLGDKLGPLVFQFEYLNKKKIGSLGEFINRFGKFARQLPDGYDYFVETRNPNYLKKPFFDFLASAHLHPVFIQGYYMPPIFQIYNQFKEQVRNKTMIRLLGPERQKIEKQTGNSWDAIVAPKDKDIDQLKTMLGELAAREVETFLYVNNHFEGSAPRTISRIAEALGLPAPSLIHDNTS